MNNPGQMPAETLTSERQRLGWDVKNAPKNYFWLIVFQVGSSIFAFGSVWLITRRSGSEGYGAVFAVIAASQIVQIFTNWTTVAVVRFGVDEFVETGAIARTFWSRFVILATNLGILLAIASLWFPALAGIMKLPSETFWLLISHFVISAIWLHVQMGMQAAKMLREQGFWQMIERMLIFAAIGVLLAGGLLELRTALLCYIAAPLLMTFTGIVHLRGVIFARFSIDPTTIRKTLVYSLPLLPYWLVGYLSGSYIDAAFISSFLSKADLGVYSVATLVNGIAMQIPTIANTILFPLLITQQAESDGKRSFFFFRHILPSSVLMWGMLCAVLAFTGYLLVPIVFGPEFAGAAVPMWILLASSVFWIPVAVGYAALANATSATYISLVASSLSAAVNLAANFYLIPRYGMVGCAWATFFAYAASVGIFAVLLKGSSGMPYSWTFLAFIPSVVGAVILAYFEMPLLALGACAAASLVIATIKRTSISEMHGFLNGFLRGSHGAN